jgi:hypothetical protein
LGARLSSAPRTPSRNFDAGLVRALGDHQSFYRDAGGAPAALMAHFDGETRLPEGDIIATAK